MNFSFVFKPKLIIAKVVRFNGRTTEADRTFSDWDFQNYQRILQQQYHFSTAHMQLFAIFQIAGLAGFFAIWPTKLGLSVALSVGMLVLTGALGLVWWREHVIQREAKVTLENQGVQFPKPSGLVKTAYVWQFVFFVFVVIWGACLTISFLKLK